MKASVSNATATFKGTKIWEANHPISVCLQSNMIVSENTTTLSMWIVIVASYPAL